MKKKPEYILDEWLVSAALTGDKLAFTRLLERWQPKLVTFAMSHLQDREAANDATQDTLFQVTKNLKQLKDPAAFPKWIYQILHRRCIDKIRQIQRRRQYERPEEEAEHKASHCEAQSALFEKAGLNTAIARLDIDARQIIRLFYLEEFTLKDISEILSIPTGTVKSRLFKARQQLKDHMEQLNED